jgi:GNAT superfamily N-acetyltransferase
MKRTLTTWPCPAQLHVGVAAKGRRLTWAVTAADAGLIERVEAENLANQIAGLVASRAAPAATVLRFGATVAAITPPEFGRKLNHVVGFGMSDMPLLEQLVSIERGFAAAGVPVEIDLCPFAHPSTLALLEERGYRATAFLNTYVHISRDRHEPRGWPGVSVRQIAESEVEAFIGQSSPRPASLLHALACSAGSRLDTILYVAEVEGVIAGTAALAVMDIDGVRAAHLYLASTLPAFRGRGVQAALLDARLSDASASHVRLATITARPTNTSARNTIRAGFHTAYTKVSFRRLPAAAN